MQTSGIGASLRAAIIENFWDYLDSPIMCLSSQDAPTPYADTLEDWTVEWPLFVMDEVVVWSTKKQSSAGVWNWIAETSYILDSLWFWVISQREISKNLWTYIANESYHFKISQKEKSSSVCSQFSDGTFHGTEFWLLRMEIILHSFSWSWWMHIWVKGSHFSTRWLWSCYYLQWWGWRGIVKMSEDPSIHVKAVFVTKETEMRSWNT